MYEYSCEILVLINISDFVHFFNQCRYSLWSCKFDTFVINNADTFYPNYNICCLVKLNVLFVISMYMHKFRVLKMIKLIT